MSGSSLGSGSIRLHTDISKGSPGHHIAVHACTEVYMWVPVNTQQREYVQCETKHTRKNAFSVEKTTEEAALIV